MIYMAMFTQNASAAGRWRRLVIPTKGGLDIYDIHTCLYNKQS